MNKKTIIRKLAIFLATAMFCESVMANTEVRSIESVSESTVESTDGEHTEEAIETTTDYIGGDIVATPAAIEEEEPLLGMTDEVLSDDALDFELDTEGIPDYAAAIAMSNGRYSDLDESSKFYLNRYIGVREDTMTECENNGLGISEAIPMALLMQRLKTDYSHAVDMVISRRSQTKALESSMEYREREFEIGFLAQEEFKSDFVDLLIEGYNTEEIIDSFAVAQCVGVDVKDVITKDKNVIESNTETFESVIEKSAVNINPFALNMSISEEDTEEQVTNESTLSLANKCSVRADSLSDYMIENDLTAEDMEIEILAMRVELGIDDESVITDKLGSMVQTYSSDETINDIKNDSTYKEGPFNYKNSLTDNVDVGTGTLSYVDSVLDLSGKSSLDFNLNLMYFSKSNNASQIDDRVNVAGNWQFSLPYLMSRDGSGVYAVKDGNNIAIESALRPKYIVMSDGSKYPIDEQRENDYNNRDISHCGLDNMHLKCDYDSSGGNNSCFEITHMNGSIDYFNKNGQWISTVNCFGNSIKVMEYTKTDTSNCLTIQDTLGKTITITTTKTTNGYSQTVTRPDGTNIEYTYETVIVGSSSAKRTVLKQKREFTDNSNSVTTDFTYEYINPNTQKVGYDALLKTIKFPTGMVSNYEYSWHKQYSLSPYVYEKGDRQYYMRVYWRTHGEMDSRVSKKWVTVGGINKDIEKYDYFDANYSYSSGTVVYPENHATDGDVCIGDSKDGDGYESAMSNASEILFTGHSVKVSQFADISGNTIKGYNNYSFNEYGKNTLIESYVNGELYSNVENTYRNMYSPYPSIRETFVENMYKKEEINYSPGSLYECTTKDISGNVISYERTDFDSGKLSEEHYCLPLRMTIKKNDFQDIVTEYTLVNDGTGNSKKAIATEKTYLSDSVGTTRLRTDYTYSSMDLGRLTQQKNYTSGSNYVTTTYTYNSTTASPVKQVYNDGTANYETNFEYDSLGLLKKVINPKGFTTTYIYDKIGSIITEAFSGGGISTTKSYAYNYTGNTLTLTNENGKKFRYNYDQAGNLSSVVDMTNNNTLERYTYDVYMRPVTQVSGGATTTLTYDSRDRVTSKVTKNSGGTKLAQEDYTYTNNSTGLLTTTTVLGDDNACTYTTSVQQDVLGRNVSETNRQGGVTTYTYDMAGNVAKIVTPRVYGDYSITYTYDHAGNVLSETETGLMAEEELKQTTINRYYEYDMLGRLKSSTDGKGKKTNYTYWGGMDWVKEIKTPFSGTTTGKTTYELIY